MAAANTTDSIASAASSPPPAGRGRRLLRGRFGSLQLLLAVFLATSLALRTALLVRSFTQMDHRAAAVLAAYGLGVLFDAVSAFCFVLPAALYLTLAPDRLLRWRPTRYLGLGVYFLAIFLILFDAAAEWVFWGEFGGRFDFIAVDYLVYTHEVVANIFESYPVVAVVSAIVAVAAGIVLLTRRRVLASYRSATTLRARLRAGALYALLPCLLLPWMRTSWAEASANRYNNELAKNGLFSLVEAFFDNTIDYAAYYPRRDEEAVFTRLRQILRAGGGQFQTGDVRDVTRVVAAAGPELHRNVVVLVVESLSARFLGSFGNDAGLTPNLDALAAEGLLLDHFYATGTRTVRGLEAIAMSIPPTPGRSVIKRPHNAGLFTVGQVFRSRGYDTRFLYGGYGYFDNMNAFFAGNGFDIVDRADFAGSEVTFSNAWGVCDGDLLNRVLTEGDRSFHQDRPFLSIVMTTSNHRPYTYPPKIDIPSGTGRAGAVKYTDYAIGQFIRQARARPWFDQTVFLITADHCASSAGKVNVPVDHYHIPLIVYAPGLVAPGRCGALSSQIDLAPTLLGLLNFSYTSRFFGQDVLRRPPGRALLGTYQKLGLLRADTLVLLEPGHKASAWHVGPDGAQEPASLDEAHLFDTIAYYQAASYLLSHGRLSAGPR